MYSKLLIKPFSLFSSSRIIYNSINQKFATPIGRSLHGSIIINYPTETSSTGIPSDASSSPIKPLLRQVLHIIPPERIDDPNKVEFNMEEEIKKISQENGKDYIEIFNDLQILEKAANRLLKRNDVGILGTESMHVENLHESIHPERDDVGRGKILQEQKTSNPSENAAAGSSTS